MSVYAANLNFIDSDCVGVSLGYYVAVYSHCKANLIFKDLTQGDVYFGICEGAAGNCNFIFHVIFLKGMKKIHIMFGTTDYFFAAR